MYKILRADKDAYITNKVVKGSRKTISNVGQAGSLDLFKLYGATTSGSSPNTELSRILIHFDLSPLKSMMSTKSFDINSQNFTCKLRLRDVYGGQPTPSNFIVSVFPLSASFEEGLGKDVVYLSDKDACNWISSSYETPWILSGCAEQGSNSTPCDYITSSTSVPVTEAKQTFKEGFEDLVVDVTKLVSSTLTGEIPDSGFRISFENSYEVNTRSYFVKRFGSRHAYNETKRPTLIVGFDDSVQDDSQNLAFDSTCFLNLYNYAGGSPANITSGSTLSEITGSNCLLLKLSTPISGGTYDLFFTGSQKEFGTSLTGSYQAAFIISSTDPVVQSKLLTSSSVEFSPIWLSLDGSIAYITGSAINIYPPDRSSEKTNKNYVVNVLKIQDSYVQGQKISARLHIFDSSNPLIKMTRLPVEMPGIVVKNAYYQVRDAVTNEVVMPFDMTTNATKISNDSKGMFFEFDAEDLITGRTYVIDILISHGGEKTHYQNASPIFRVDSNLDAT